MLFINIIRLNTTDATPVKLRTRILFHNNIKFYREGNGYFMYFGLFALFGFKLFGRNFQHRKNMLNWNSLIVGKRDL